MVIGFLGKGGSGKSTLSARFVRFLAAQGKTVLAVDADHNMDLSFNLGVESVPNYLGSALPDLLKYCGLDAQADSYYKAFFIDNEPQFRLSPADAFTARYANPISERLWLMSSGPHTESVLLGKNCSHFLSTPLKVYLPFLELNKDQYVVVDEKAGSDGAGTGISSGLDHAFLILEPTPYGVKAAHQIAGLLEFYGTPYDFVINKAYDGDEVTQTILKLRKSPAHTFYLDKSFRDIQSETSGQNLQNLSDMLARLSTTVASNRKERSRQKFARNQDFFTPTTVAP